MIPLTPIKPSRLNKLVFGGPSSNGCHPSLRHVWFLLPGVILNAHSPEEWSPLDTFNAELNESGSAFPWTNQGLRGSNN